MRSRADSGVVQAPPSALVLPLLDELVVVLLVDEVVPPVVDEVVVLPLAPPVLELPPMPVPLLVVAAVAPPLPVEPEELLSVAFPLEQATTASTQAGKSGIEPERARRGAGVMRGRSSAASVGGSGIGRVLAQGIAASRPSEPTRRNRPYVPTSCPAKSMVLKRSGARPAAPSVRWRFAVRE